MAADDLLSISRYVMPSLPLLPAKLGFLFGTRHGIDEFCLETHALWQRGMFRQLLISGGNYFGLPTERWHEHGEFRARVLNAYRKIPHYLQQDFLRELDGHAPYPLPAAAP